jgi:hypothetical protein
MAVAGAGVAVAVQWTGQSVAPSVEVRAVIDASSVETEQGRGGTTRDHTVRAVTASGRVIDLAGSGNGAGLTASAAGLDRGAPVLVTRSTYDGEILAVRSPLATVPVAQHGAGVVLRVLGLLVAAAALVLGVRGWSRSTVGVPVLCAVGGLALTALLIRPAPDLGLSPYPLPDAMAGYADPPTGPSPDPLLSTRTVDAVATAGTPVPTAPGDSLTVTGPPVAGTAGGFDTVRIPLAVDPGDGAPVPNLRLVGTGAGRTVELPDCGPSGLPPRLTTPGEGVVCFAVPDDFAPRYLVLTNDGVAIELG